MATVHFLCHVHQSPHAFVVWGYSKGTREYIWLHDMYDCVAICAVKLRFIVNLVTRTCQDRRRVVYLVVLWLQAAAGYMPMPAELLIKWVWLTSRFVFRLYVALLVWLQLGPQSLQQWLRPAQKNRPWLDSLAECKCQNNLRDGKLSLGKILNTETSEPSHLEKAFVINR